MTPMSVEEAIQRPRAMTVLQSNALFSVLTSPEMDSLASVARLVRAERGELIWFHGSEVDYVGLCADGWIKMVRSSPTGVDATIELFGPGQIFGLLGAVSGCGCPLSAYAVTDLWYLRIPKKTVLDVYEGNVPLKDRLIRKASMRLYGAIDLAARMSSGRVDERIAAILFLLSESYGVKDPTGIRLQVPLTRQEIGEMAGTTVESTIRVMSRWQKDGIVETDHQHIVILDELRLSKILSQ